MSVEMLRRDELLSNFPSMRVKLPASLTFVAENRRIVGLEGKPEVILLTLCERCHRYDLCHNEWELRPLICRLLELDILTLSMAHSLEQSLHSPAMLYSCIPLRGFLVVHRSLALVIHKGASWGPTSPHTPSTCQPTRTMLSNPFLTKRSNYSDGSLAGINRISEWMSSIQSNIQPLNVSIYLTSQW